MRHRRINPSAALAIALATASCNAPSDDEPRIYQVGAKYALADPTCNPMTAADERRAQIALDVMGEFPRHASIYSGAMDVFGRPKNLGDRVRYCVSPELKDEVVRRTTAASAWDWGLPGLSRLALANELGPRDAAIVQDVARAAFLNRPIEEAPFSDIRPMARSILASFGSAAGPWRAEALSAMNADDQLGTSAAQVAGASGEPEAIDRVASLMKSAYGNAPPTGPIASEQGQRLVELSLALGVAGEKAREHVPILVTFLGRDVLKGSHFGMLELPPTDVCRALRAISGPEAMTAVNGPRCQLTDND